MTKKKLIGVTRALAVWAVIYLGLRLTLFPWRQLEKPSLAEMGLAATLCGFYFLLWKKLRSTLAIGKPHSFLKAWRPAVILLAWMIAYLGFWRASPHQFTSGLSNFISEYFRTEFLGGFVLSEITEEIAYRGVLLFLLIGTGLSVSASIALQAFVFLLLHYIGVAEGHMDFARSVSTLLLGVLFGWSAATTRRLSVPIFLHIFWNFVAGFVFRFVERS